MMPLITRRSSTRATPRTLFGNSGRSRSNCSSLNQNSLKSTLPLTRSVNHIPNAKGILFMGPDPRDDTRHRPLDPNEGQFTVSPSEPARPKTYKAEAGSGRTAVRLMSAVPSL